MRSSSSALSALRHRPVRLLGLASMLASLTGCGASYDRKASMAGYPSTPPPQAVPVGYAGSPESVDRDAPQADFGETTGAMPEQAPRKASSPPPPPPPEPPRSEAPSGPSTPPAEADRPKASSAKPPGSRDHVIYTARFTMAVYQVDQGLSAVEKIARDNGGYLGQKNDREITVRVPRGRFDAAVGALNEIGDVLHREIAADDVTDVHVDLEIRIKNARAMQRRLTELLARADVKDALAIEKELHRVTEELERLEGRLKLLDDRIAFSTITVAFQPRGAALQAARVRLPFPWLRAMNLPSLLSLSEEQ